MKSWRNVDFEPIRKTLRVFTYRGELPSSFEVFVASLHHSRSSRLIFRVDLLLPPQGVSSSMLSTGHLTSYIHLCVCLDCSNKDLMDDQTTVPASHLILTSLRAFPTTASITSSQTLAGSSFGSIRKEREPILAQVSMLAKIVQLGERRFSCTTTGSSLRVLKSILRQACQSLSRSFGISSSISSSALNQAHFISSKIQKSCTFCARSIIDTVNDRLQTFCTLISN